jgi:hypothetical protein
MPSTPHEHNMETKTSLQTPNNHKEWAASMISAIREKNRTNDSPKFHTLVANVEQMLDESDLEKIQLFFRIMTESVSLLTEKEHSSLVKAVVTRFNWSSEELLPSLFRFILNLISVHSSFLESCFSSLLKKLIVTNGKC